jgi:hypothetical protein
VGRGLDVRGWRAIGASIRGTGHARTDTPCQDANESLLLPDGTLVAAVADGAGSASHSQRGAAVAVAAAVRFVADHGIPASVEADAAWREVLARGLENAAEAVRREAEALALPASALASTLILSVATQGCIAAGQIGDGAAVCADKEGRPTLLTRPQAGEYVNETRFVVSPDGLAGAEYAVLRGNVRYLALFSDGLQRLALRFPEADPHPPFFAALFRFTREATDMTSAAQELATFLGSPRVVDRTDDDVTLLLATDVEG